MSQIAKILNSVIGTLPNLSLDRPRPMDREPEMIVSQSYVAGRIVGLMGGEEYWMKDGTAWRVVTPVYCRRPSESPRATVYRRGEIYLMAIKGMPETVEVEPVHLPRVTLETPSTKRRTDLDELRDRLKAPFEFLNSLFSGRYATR